jgi:hypothetical protein
LGAALWIIALENGAPGFNSGDERASAAIDRFVESADYEFECSKIVGRQFENASDHASYLCAGGCSKIIAALSAQGG